MFQQRSIFHTQISNKSFINCLLVMFLFRTYAIVSQEIDWYFLSCHVIDDVGNIFYIYFSGPDIISCHHYVCYHHERSSLVVVGHID